MYLVTVCSVQCTVGSKKERKEKRKKNLGPGYKYFCASVLLVRSYVNIREILRTVRHSEGRGATDNAAQVRQTRDGGGCGGGVGVLFRPGSGRGGRWESRGAAVGGAKAAPRNRPPHRTSRRPMVLVRPRQRGGLAVPVVHNAPAYPHDGGAALHAQGYAYGPIRSAPAGAAAAFPANYIAPGAPVPMSAPSLGSFVQLRQGKTFPASGIGNHNHFLNTIYTHPHVVWHSHAPWHQHALYPNPQATTWYRPPLPTVPGAAHHTIHHTIHHHQTLITNPSYIPAADHDSLLVPLPPPTAFCKRVRS